MSRAETHKDEDNQQETDTQMSEDDIKEIPKSNEMTSISENGEKKKEKENLTVHTDVEMALKTMKILASNVEMNDVSFQS